MSAQTIDRRYANPSLDLIRKIVENGNTFVYGGSCMFHSFSIFVASGLD